MIGLDSTGLSDPFIRTVLHNQSIDGDVKYQTNNPKWNKTFVIDEVVFYEKFDQIIRSPPEIIVQIFDQDLILGIKVSF